MRCLMVKRCVPWALRRLLLPATLFLLLLLLLAVMSAGRIEEWALSPSGRVALRVTRPASIHAASLKARAPSLYRVVNPTACAGHPVFLLVWVVSKPAHQEQRQAIRATWGLAGQVRGRRVRTLFALGLPATPQESQLIDQEAQRYGDVVQGRFADTYLNLTLKTLMVLRWATTYCPTARFLLKSDDDVFINLPALVEHLSHRDAAFQDLYLGRVHSNVPVDRDPSSLSYVSESAYPGRTFPPYCSGTAYVLSADVAHKVYVAARSMPLLNIEDVFVGICAAKVGVFPTPTCRMSGSHRIYLHYCCYKHIFSSHHMAPAELRVLWALVNNQADCWLLQKYAALLLCNSLQLLDQARYLWQHFT
ncbi:beta-1,3-galactosyltransferase 9 [Narcine bancroftii]|uniref:beta-1,3-galactosyltransferase 9 n=1 Tax=Narcine bancroftii TaxID=1343680 RepID=UPI003831E099